jgi:iron complex outermembrane receptor protein
MYAGGNPNLKPEKSTQWNLGWVWQATDTTSFGLNYWAVDITDAVSSVSESLIFQNPATYLNLFRTKYKASTNETYVAILDAATNIGKARNRGVDWDITYRGKTQYGKLEGKLAGTYMIKSEYTIPGTTTFTDSLGKFGVNDAVTFRNVIVATGTVGVGAFEHTLSMNYKSGYRDQVYPASWWTIFDSNWNPIEGALTVPEHMTFDWRTQWKPNKQLTLVLGIKNVFDEDPPLSLRTNGAGHQLGYDPRYASPYGRTFSLQATYEF